MLIMNFLLFLSFAISVSSKSLMGNTFKRSKDSQFITTSGNTFQLNGQPFKFIGTNAYWLSSLNSDQDIVDTLGNMSAIGIKVVRTWGFNDVTTIPANGTWFQLIANKTTTINTGPNGLQRLDKVIEVAGKFGMHVLLSLTNNWNPSVNDTKNALNRNYLSNSYGGMDAYVREFGKNQAHDDFYNDDNIISIFKNYTTTVISRYVDNPTVFAWEIANDPRCISTLQTANCNPQTVTKWHSTIAQHISSVDPNHIIGAGTGGFQCVGCPKLFPLAPPPPPPPGPRPSAAAARRASKRDLIKERAEERKRIREEKKRNGGLREVEQLPVRIRGRWIATPTKRQSQNMGSAFDGSQGVDSQDIANIPQVGFTSFQLFPDTDNYAPTGSSQNVAPVNETGIQWIHTQAQTSATYGKPAVLNGFGVVTQNNAPDYVPPNSTTVANTTSTSPTSSDNSTTTSGVSDDQRDSTYQQWLQAGISSGINGMMQYQWGQGNLTASAGTAIQAPNTQGTNPDPSAGNSQSPAANSTGVSPNDGYTTSGTGQNGVENVLQNASMSQNVSPSS